MNETVGLLFAMFVLTIIFGALALLWDCLKERFICWELTWNHPEGKHWRDERGDLIPETWWGPRLPWLCTFADWITGGECHD
jgi:hypothetical protein